VNARDWALPEGSEHYSKALTQETRILTALHTNPQQIALSRQVGAEGGEPVLAAASQEQSNFNGLDNSGHEGSAVAEQSIAQQPESSRSTRTKSYINKLWGKLKGKSNNRNE